ncbi:MAG: DUF4864 domain-containing protein [Orrella sp.]
MSTSKKAVNAGTLKTTAATLLLLWSGVAMAGAPLLIQAPAPLPTPSAPRTPVPGSVNNPIQAVIQNQISAFQADNFEVAFSYAAPNIQRAFGNARRFAQMIVSSFPMVWRPVEVKYLKLTRSGPYALQRVMVTDQQNTLHLLVYQLVPINQDWRISGVEILAMPGERI